MGNGNGYDGWSMSNNARDAYMKAVCLYRNGLNRRYWMLLIDKRQ